MFEALALSTLLAALTFARIAMTRYAPTQRDNLLHHSLRQQILEIVQKNPGLSKGDLRSRLQCSWSTIHHHVGLLNEAGLLKSARLNGHVRFFHSAMSQKEITVLALLKHGRTLDFARAVVGNPGLMQNQALTTAAMSRKVVKPYIKRMTEAGLITEIREGGCCRYHPTPQLLTALVHMQTPSSDPPQEPAHLVLQEHLKQQA